MKHCLKDDNFCCCISNLNKTFIYFIIRFPSVIHNNLTFISYLFFFCLPFHPFSELYLSTHHTQAPSPTHYISTIFTLHPPHAVHVGSVRQTATILSMSSEHLRTGDKAQVIIMLHFYIHLFLILIIKCSMMKCISWLLSTPTTGTCQANNIM